MEAAHLSGGAQPLSLRHGVRCESRPDEAVEDVLLAVGEFVGCENIISASRMKKAVVVFLKEKTLALLDVRMIPLNCKSSALQHVLSFRRRVLMFLNEPALDISFRVSYEGRSYMLYASTGSMRCFECGDVGHERLICPHRARVSEEAGPGSSGDEGRQVSVEQSAGPGEGTEERPASAAAADISVSDSVSEVGAHGVDTERLDGSRASSEAHEGEGGSETAPSAQVETVSTGDAAVGESVVSVDMPVTQEEEEEEAFSDIASQAREDQPLYSVQEINAFLDETFGKVVEMTDFFPDVERFVASVAKIRKTANFDDLSKQKRFRLKKILTKLRRGKAPVKRKCSD
ncbi:hypothetical protein MHYP_G00329490 [Metynnis hypsauchen]